MKQKICRPCQLSSHTRGFICVIFDHEYFVASMSYESTRALIMLTLTLLNILFHLIGRFCFVFPSQWMQDKSAKNVNVTGTSLKVFSRSEAAFFRWYTVYVFSNRRFEKERFTGRQIVEIFKQISSSCYHPFPSTILFEKQEQ